MSECQKNNYATDVFIGRQPIFDRDQKLFAYELLYRESENNCAIITDPNVSTSEVIINSLTEFGFDALVGNSLAFINLTKDFLTGNKPLPLPIDHVVIEILEDVEVDDDLINGLKKLSADGFSLALDDFIYTEKWDAVLPLVDYIKVEIPLLTDDEVKQHVARLKQYDVKLLAEKIESEEEFLFLHDCGFDYFQGYFLARPKVFKGKSIPANKLTLLKLLVDLNDNEISAERLVEDISNDVSLCYKILRYINSAHFALNRKVESIHEAIIYVGLKKLRHWASLITLSSLNDSSSELLQLAMIRAHMCEQIAGHSGNSDTQNSFSAGLLSTLEALLCLPMNEILKSLPISNELRVALLEHEGATGEILKCTIAYEQGDWENAAYKQVSTTQLKDSYFSALSFSNEMNV